MRMQSPYQRCCICWWTNTFEIAGSYFITETNDRCRRLIDCLPALQHDPMRPEDVLKVDADEDGIGGDDAADALRYMVATKPRIIVQRKLCGL